MNCQESPAHAVLARQGMFQAMQGKAHALIDLLCDFESARYSRNTVKWCQLFVRAFDFGRAYGDQARFSCGEKPTALLETITLGARVAELDRDKQQAELAHAAWLASLPNAKVLMELASKERIWFEHYRFKPEVGGGWSVANSYWQYNVDHLRGLEDFERVLEMIRADKRIGPLPPGYEYLDLVDLPESIRRALYTNIADAMDQYLRVTPLWRWYTQLIWSLMEQGVLLDDSQPFQYDDPTGLQFHQHPINSRP